MKNNKEVAAIEIDADLYDALELSAHVFGGIGAGYDFDYKNDLRDNACPHCIAGHAAFICNDDSAVFNGLVGEQVAWERYANDRAVSAINKRKGKEDGATLDRVTWKQYVKERNFVRKAA